MTKPRPRKPRDPPLLSDAEMRRLAKRFGKVADEERRPITVAFTFGPKPEPKPITTTVEEKDPSWSDADPR